MSLFNIRIAGHTIQIKTMHTRTESMCRDFITDERPEICVTINQKDIDSIKKKSIKHKEISEPWDGLMEFSAVLQRISDELIDYGVFMLHGAAIALDGEAYIFSGRSGIGKSTHILHWINNCSNTIVINGDRPFILTGETPMVCGSPWAGKERVYTNTTIPLKAIIMLERSSNNVIKQIKFSDAFIPLLSQTYHPEDAKKMKDTLRMLKSLEESVLFYRFQINNFKEDCFEVAYNELHG